MELLTANQLQLPPWPLGKTLSHRAVWNEMVHNKVQVLEAENAVAECICRTTSFAASVPDRWTGVFWE